LFILTKIYKGTAPLGIEELHTTYGFENVFPFATTIVSQEIYLSRCSSDIIG